MTSAKHDAVMRLQEAGRRHSTAVVLFHAALAERAGLTAVESKTMEIVERLGPMTHGELVEATGMAPASVTGLLARLEQKGAARRLPHPDDARRILVDIDPQYVARSRALFTAFLDGLDEIAADYTAEQLDLIAGFLNRAGRMQQQAALDLARPPAAGFENRGRRRDRRRKGPLDTVEA